MRDEGHRVLPNPRNFVPIRFNLSHILNTAQKVHTL